MILTAYFDESGTHGASGLSLMAGFLADAQQWRKFEKRASKLFSRFRVNIFHSIDLKRTDKDFEGWSVDRKIEFLDEFQHIVNETLELGVVAMLRPEDYDYYTKLSWPKGARKDSLYTILFRACLSSVVDRTMTIDRWAQGKEPRLNVVVESGHRNAEDAVRFYNFVSKKFKGQSQVLGGLTFQDKKDCLPLGAADLFAYNVYRTETGGKPLGQAKKPTKSDKSYRGNLYHIRLNRATLDGLHEQALQIANERSSAAAERPS